MTALGNQQNQQGKTNSHQRAFGNDLYCLLADLPELLEIFDLLQFSGGQTRTARRKRHSGLIQRLKDGYGSA